MCIKYSWHQAHFCPHCGKKNAKAGNIISFIFPTVNQLLKNLRNKELGNKGATWGKMGQYIYGAELKENESLRVHIGTAAANLFPPADCFSEYIENLPSNRFPKGTLKGKPLPTTTESRACPSLLYKARRI